MFISENQKSPLETAQYLNLNSAIIWQNNYPGIRDTSFYAWIGDDHPPVSDEYTVAIFKIKTINHNGKDN